MSPFSLLPIEPLALIPLVVVGIVWGVAKRWERSNTMPSSFWQRWGFAIAFAVLSPISVVVWLAGHWLAHQFMAGR